MINKRCFLVTAYCDTPIKKKTLEDTLKNISRYNTDIILFSHYPIEKHIQELTDYSIYDYSNPILGPKDGRSMINWRRFRFPDVEGNAFKINTHAVDYGYAAAQQIKRGILFANEIGYDEVIILNYDLIVYDKMVDDFNEGLLTYDSIVPIYGGEKGLYMAWFALKIKPFLNNIKSITREDYSNTIDESIVEEYLYSKFTGDNSLTIPRLEWEGPNPLDGWIKTSVVMEGNILPRFQEKEFTWFIGHEILHIKDGIIGTDKKILLLWQIKKDLNIEVYLKNQIIHKSIVYKKYNYQLIYLPIEHLEFNSYLNTDKLKIVINGWEIPKELLILNSISSIEIAYSYE